LCHETADLRVEVLDLAFVVGCEVGHGVLLVVREERRHLLHRRLLPLCQQIRMDIEIAGHLGHRPIPLQ